MSALCCIMYLCKSLMWISWDRCSKTKNHTLLAKVAKNNTVNFNSDCVSRVATVGYFSCFVENLPNSKSHFREQKKNPKEEESKMKWKAIVTSTRQWNNKNDYLNIYIWLEDHCVILDINKYGQKLQNKQKTVVYILETVLKKNSLESNDCTSLSTTQIEDYCRACPERMLRWRKHQRCFARTRNWWNKSIWPYQWPSHDGLVERWSVLPHNLHALPEWSGKDKVSLDVQKVPPVSSPYL